MDNQRGLAQEKTGSLSVCATLLSTVFSSGSLTVNNPAALREALLAGVGISVAPVWLVHESIQLGKLNVILKDYVPIALDINAVYRKRLYVQQKVVLMIDHLRESFKQSLKKMKV